MSSRERDNDAGRAAAFLIEVLALPEDAAAIGEELTLVDRDQVVTVFAAEFESSVGPAAFLVYLYRLEQVDDDGRRGADRFREDLETLETAARLDTPGPRAVSHSESEDVALILATSPAIMRALQGTSAEQDGIPAEQVAPSELLKIRAEQAVRLLRVLKSADRAAAAWLAAIEATPSAALIPEETELSLFLNDEQSIKSLLRALNRLLNAFGSTRSNL